MPLSAEPILEGARSMTAAGHHGWWLTVMGRLQPGVTAGTGECGVAADIGADFA